MSRRSSRRGATRAKLAEASLPPNIQRGLASLVEGNEDLVASMLSMDRNHSDEPATNAVLVAALSKCMRTNDLSAEAFLARFFSAPVLGTYCKGVLGVSGKGNEATLAARIGKKWSKPGFEIQIETTKDGAGGDGTGTHPTGGTAPKSAAGSQTDETETSKKRGLATSSENTKCAEETDDRGRNAKSNKKSRTVGSGDR